MRELAEYNPANYSPNARALVVLTERIALVRSYCKSAFDDDDFKSVINRNLRSKGGVTYQRIIMLAKAAMINRGQNLSSYWTIFEIEMAIPVRCHFWEIDEGQWGSVGARMASDFYRTRMLLSPVEERLYDGRWIPEETDMAGFGVIAEDEALFWIGTIGGQLPYVDHPVGTLRGLDQTVRVPPGIIRQFSPEVYFGLPPYAIAVSHNTSNIDWVIVSPESDFVTVSPPPNADLGTYSVVIQATDAQGERAAMIWRIVIEAPLQ